MSTKLSKLFFLLFALCTPSAISQSDSDSDSSDSSEDNLMIMFGGLFSIEGSSEIMNVCVRSDGNIYMAVRNEFDFVDMVGRSTTGVIEVSDDIFEITFDAYMFNDATVGTENLIVTLTFNENTGQYTLTMNGETIDLSRSEAEADPEACFMPAIQDFTIDFPSIDVSGDLSEICGVPCVHIGILPGPSLSDEGCWGFYYTEQNEFGSGGTYTNGILAWDGELTIHDFSDLSDVDLSGGVCETGSEFIVLSSEVTLQRTAKCTGLDFGGTFLASTECDALIALGIDCDITCPLFDSLTTAKRMTAGNSLREESNGDLSKRIVINLSNATIGNLWGIVIVFMSVTLILCWLNKRKNIF